MSQVLGQGLRAFFSGNGGLFLRWDHGSLRKDWEHIFVSQGLAPGRGKFRGERRGRGRTQGNFCFGVAVKCFS